MTLADIARLKLIARSIDQALMDELTAAEIAAMKGK